MRLTLVEADEPPDNTIHGSCLVYSQTCSSGSGNFKEHYRGPYVVLEHDGPAISISSLTAILDTENPKRAFYRGDHIDWFLME